MDQQQQAIMKMAIELSEKGMNLGKGGPFGCVIVKNGIIVGKGYYSVLSTNDPTAHAEMVAIRDACKTLDSYQLDGCEIFTSCEPCPMCLGAINRARPAKVFFANTQSDATVAGLMRDQTQQVFKSWIKKTDKSVY